MMQCGKQSRFAKLFETRLPQEPAKTQRDEQLAQAGPNILPILIGAGHEATLTPCWAVIETQVYLRVGLNAAPIRFPDGLTQPAGADDNEWTNVPMTRASFSTTSPSAPGRKRLKGLLLGAGAAALAGALIVSAPSPVKAEVNDADQIGTAEGLPITLSGSYLSGRLAGQSRDIANAAAFFQEALDSDPGNVFLLDRTFVLHVANGDIDRALDLAERLTADQPDHFLARVALAADAIHMQDFDRAVKLLDRGTRGPLAELTGRLVRAWALAAQGKTDPALESIAALDGPDWFNVFTTHHAGLIQELAGRSDAALDNFNSAFAADPGALRVVEALARARARAGDTAGAVKVIDNYGKIIPGHPVMRELRARIDEGGEIAPMVDAHDRGAAEVLYGLGAALGRDGGEELSAAYLQLAIHLDPRADIALIALANLFQRIDDQARSIALLQRVDEKSPLKRDAEIQIGLNYNSLDNLEEARAHLEKLVESDPADLEAVTALGNVLRAHQLFDDAGEAYSQGIATIDADPAERNWTLYYYRGICYERIREWDAAEADFRKALELSPDQPLVLNYLGYSLVDRGLKLDEALGMIRKAVELRPQDGYIVDSLGWAYYKLGRYGEAVVELEKAVQLRPEDPIINDHLGDAYWQVGRRLEARFQWNHARDLEPEEEELAKILDKIENGLSEANTENGAITPPEKKNGG